MLRSGGTADLELVGPLAQALVNGRELDSFGTGSEDKQDAGRAVLICGDK